MTGWRRGIGAAVAAIVEATDHEVVRFVGDVADEIDWAMTPPVDALVNCAGIGFTNPLGHESLEQFDRVMAVNFRGPVLGMRHVLPRMVEAKRGHIVNITSIYAEDAGVGLSFSYHTSKAALSMATRNAARRYARHGIRINEVRPGFTDTEMSKAYWTSQGYREYVNGGTPLQRMAHPEEIAKVVMFLLSDESSYMTGASVAVDGGWLA